MNQYKQSEIYKSIKIYIAAVKKNKYNEENCLININTLLDLIFELYNSSIIAGQYINPKTIKKLDKFTLLINELHTEMFGSSGQIEDKINLLNDVVEQSANLISVLHSRTCLDQQDRTYFSDSSYLGQFRNKNNNFQSDGYHLFTLNIKIAFLDHFLAIKRRHLDELVEIREELSEIKYKQNKYAQILTDKCNFLIFKILFRLSKDEKQYIYLYNQKYSEINIEEIKSNVIYFKDFLSITESHYSDQNTSNKITNNLNISSKGKLIDKKWKNDELLNVEEYHTLIKFSKDIQHSKTELEKIKEDFFIKSEVEQTSAIGFDKKAYDIDKIYVYNNLISSSIDKEEELNNIMVMLDEAYELQKITGIKNYFPFFKIAQYNSFLIEEEFKTISSKEYEGLGGIESNMERYKKIVNECYIQYKWCKNRNYSAFQLPYKECIKLIPNEPENPEHITVFLASSFVLPLNYDEIETQLSKIDRDYNRIKTQITLYKTIKYERTEIERIRQQIAQQGNSLKNEVLEKDRKQIEILGIFAAIVLFSVSEVQLFTKVKSIVEAILFSLSFAYSLGVFVMLIWLITRNYDIELSSIHKSIVKLFLAITALLYFTLLAWEFILPIIHV